MALIKIGGTGSCHIVTTWWQMFVFALSLFGFCWNQKNITQLLRFNYQQFVREWVAIPNKRFGSGKTYTCECHWWSSLRIFLGQSVWRPSCAKSTTSHKGFYDFYLYGPSQHTIQVAITAGLSRILHSFTCKGAHNPLRPPRLMCQRWPLTQHNNILKSTPCRSIQ